MTILKTPIDEDDHILGNRNAVITLLEYGDYECPSCGLAFPIVKRVQKYFGNKLKFVFRNFPLTEIHPHAEIAAETAEFAGAHNHFWEMHDQIFINQGQLGMPLFLDLIKKLKLPENEFENALINGLYKERIKNDFLGGVYSGVNGTPTFFINGQKYDRPFGYQDLIAAIEQQVVKE